MAWVSLSGFVLGRVVCFQRCLGLFSQKEELFQSAVVGAGEVGLTAGEGIEGSLVLHERGGEGGVGVGDAFEEAGFDLGAVVELGLKESEEVDEREFFAGIGVEGGDENCSDGGERGGLRGWRSVGVSGEAVLEGVLGDAVFAGFCAGASGFEGVGAVGGKAGFGEGLPFDFD